MIDLNVWFDGQIGELQEAKAQYVGDLAAKDIEGYNRGLAENVNVPDGVYTEEELANAKAEVDAKVRAEMQALVDAEKAAGEVALGELKKAVAAKIRDASVDDLAIAAELEA